MLDGACAVPAAFVEDNANAASSECSTARGRDSLGARPSRPHSAKTTPRGREATTGIHRRRRVGPQSFSAHAALYFVTVEAARASKLRMNPWRVLSFLILGALALLPRPGVAAEIAYAWAERATTPSYTPSTLYSYNDGHPVSITRLEVGRYEVNFGRVATVGANVQASMYGAVQGHCALQSWASGRVFVRCYDQQGQPADRQFSVLALAADPTDAATVMYGWLHQARPTAPYAPAPYYRFDNGSLMIEPDVSTGRYLPTWTGSAGSPAPMATAYGSAASCHIIMHTYNRSWLGCRAALGGGVDTRASLVLFDRSFPGLSYAARTTGPGVGGWSSDGSPQSMRRISTGVYSVDLGPEANRGGHVQAIAYLSTAECHVGNWGGGRATIYCHNRGVRVDSGFHVVALKRD